VECLEVRQLSSRRHIVCSVIEGAEETTGNTRLLTLQEAEGGGTVFRLFLLVGGRQPAPC
jgi:hypothetical protein